MTMTITMTNYHGGNYMKCKKCDSLNMRLGQNGYLICNDCGNKEQGKEIETLMMVKEIFGKIEEYLVDLTQQWLNMPPYRKYEPANVQVYNHIRTEIDDLKKLKTEYIKEN